jgi:hypothetical protein
MQKNMKKRRNSPRRSLTPDQLRRQREYLPLTEAELANLFEVLSGELREVALLAMLTRRSPRELVTWKQGEVWPLVDQLAQEFQALKPGGPETLLFPALARLPARLLGEKGAGRPAKSLQAMARNILASVADTATKRKHRG